MKQTKPCSAEGCTRIRKTRGLCGMHYMRARTSGELPPRLTLEDKFWLKVDKTQECWNWVGAKDGSGYGHLKWGGKDCRAHRVSFEWAHGPIPDGMWIDHRCHNPACVNPDHLRLATPSQNQENHRGPQANSRSKVRGVWWSPKRNAWVAQVQSRGYKRSIGSFSTLAEAEAAVIDYRNAVHTYNDRDRVA